MSGSSLLEQAAAALERGDFPRAAQLAARAAEAAPRDAAVLRIQGTIELRLGKPREAIALLRRSLKIDAMAASSYVALGNAQQENGQLDAAINSYRRALRFDPNALAAHNDLGTALYARGQIEDAIQSFKAALALDPEQPSVLENLGSALRRGGRFAEARSVFFRSLRLRVSGPIRRLLRGRARPAVMAQAPAGELREALRMHAAGDRPRAIAACEQILAENAQDAEALHLKGLMLVEADQAARALPLLEQAVALGPQIAEFHNTLGFCHRKLEAAGKAMAAYRRAVEINPQLGLAHVNIAELLADQEEHGGAEQAARAALSVEPDSMPARLVLIRALLGRGKHAAAETLARELVGNDADRIEGWLYLGQSLREQGRLVEAWQAFEKALTLAPRNHLVHLTAGAFFLECRRDPGKALEYYRRARELEPESASAQLNEALARFASGDYSREAWDLYESRRRQRSRVIAYQKVALPEWDGAPAPGRALLVYGEQGVGDEIMFSSMVSQAAPSFARCAYACDPRLHPLFARSFPGVRAVPWFRERLGTGAEELGGMDRAIPLASLGRFFRASPQDFPSGGAYLRADPDKAAAWRRRLEGLGSGPYIGIAWQGGIWTTGRGRRSIDLAALAGNLPARAGRWVSLQLGGDQAQIDQQAGAGRITHWPDALASVDDSAALIAALDSVVSVCSWIVHLSGALGKPVTVLAPFAAEWRYGLSGPRMAWYPSAHVLRQDAFGDWPSVFRQLRERLAG